MEEEPLNQNLIEYFWSAGSLPPPYHDEIRIVITPPEAVLTYWPDYPSEQVITKEYRIAVDESDTELIIRLLEAVEDKSWKRAAVPNLGGESEYLLFDLHDRQIEIPPGLAEQDDLIARDIYAHIRSTIPDPIWDEIEQIRFENRSK